MFNFLKYFTCGSEEDSSNNNHSTKNYKLFANGQEEFYDDFGRLHSFNDEPAVTWKNGSKAWYEHGKKHRDNDMPAVINVVCDTIQAKEWYQNDLLHRDGDKPSKISFGDKYFYSHGLLHRDNDLPAVIRKNGEREFYVYGIKV